ncbi:14870_t:CDS:2 [Rhizophagus irregularis]|nr:14870_t:CDS:2 [Rhizophagus irregularis]
MATHVESLSSQGIKLPSKLQYFPPLFDYLSYCRSINVNVINDIINISSSSPYNKFLLQQEVYKLLMKKCPDFRFLDMRSMEHQIFYFPEAIIRFESLCELKCDSSIDSIYFYGLSRICYFIQNIIIFNTNTKVNRGIVKLLENQKNLKYFKWENDFDDYVEEDTFDEIFLVLVKKSHTLTHFISTFREGSIYTFPSEILPELYNLKSLKLNFHPIFDFYYDEKFTHSIYRNLEILQLCDYILINTVVCIIKNSGGQIRKILINSFDINYNFYEDSLVLIKMIYESCPLIEHLSITFPSSKKHFNEFEKLLLICKELRVLDMLDANVIEESQEIKLLYGDNLSKVLIKVTPNNLREIRFCDYFKFSLKTLESFLENWKGSFQLSLLTSDHIYSNEDYLKLINKYKNDGVIKDFRYDFEKNNVYF